MRPNIRMPLTGYNVLRPLPPAGDARHRCRKLIGKGTTKMTAKPRVFVASSVEGLNIAYAVQENLEHTAEITVWAQGVFELSDYTGRALINELDAYDFGLFVFSFDDITKMRGEAVKISRDNVVFELGPFIGRLGLQRSFILMPRSRDNLHLPTDLLGITPATFNPDRTDENLLAALGPACHQIRRSIERLGARNHSSEANGGVTSSPRTPDTEVLNNLVNGALQTVCRAVSVPQTPESAKLRVFIFKKLGDQLVCSHYWSPNPVAVPGEEGLRGNDRGDVLQGFPPQLFSKLG
jgi:predicted nucleotide-binding protein